MSSIIQKLALARIDCYTNALSEFFLEIAFLLEESFPLLTGSLILSTPTYRSFRTSNHRNGKDRRLRGVLLISTGDSPYAPKGRTTHSTGRL
ncbi:hypothetical protein CEXT_717221 [Caerostris extrusa]|uniref:Uncharacterized protein n=1 Tax=Caerostris extrusa TaxID=172846 RepID=A0AAV4WQL7_CAEEX|nr:hypothetical protein CEXT_717221 [Caerostris extrusa]